jgi:histone H4
MSGRGKGGKGLGKGGAKRHRKVLRDNIQGVTKPAIRRLARRGGVKRISGLIYEETRGVLKVFLESILRDCVTYTEHARRKTVTAMDVVYGLKRQGRTLYGYGGPHANEGFGSKGITRRRRGAEPEMTPIQKVLYTLNNKMDWKQCNDFCITKDSSILNQYSLVKISHEHEDIQDIVDKTFHKFLKIDHKKLRYVDIYHSGKGVKKFMEQTAIGTGKTLYQIAMEEAINDEEDVNLILDENEKKKLLKLNEKFSFPLININDQRNHVLKDLHDKAVMKINQTFKDNFFNKSAPSLFKTQAWKKNKQKEKKNTRPTILSISTYFKRKGELTGHKICAFVPADANQNILLYDPNNVFENYVDIKDFNKFLANFTNYRHNNFQTYDDRRFIFLQIPCFLHKKNTQKMFNQGVPPCYNEKISEAEQNNNSLRGQCFAMTNFISALMAAYYLQDQYSLSDKIKESIESLALTNSESFFNESQTFAGCAAVFALKHLNKFAKKYKYFAGINRDTLDSAFTTHYEYLPSFGNGFFQGYSDEDYDSSSLSMTEQKKKSQCLVYGRFEIKSQPW